MKYFFFLVFCNLFFMGVSVGQLITRPSGICPGTTAEKYEETYLQLFENTDNVFVGYVVESIDPDLFDFKIIENIKGKQKGLKGLKKIHPELYSNAGIFSIYFCDEEDFPSSCRSEVNLARESISGSYLYDKYKENSIYKLLQLEKQKNSRMYKIKKRFISFFTEENETER